MMTFNPKKITDCSTINVQYRPLLPAPSPLLHSDTTVGDREAISLAVLCRAVHVPGDADGWQVDS